MDADGIHGAATQGHVRVRRHQRTVRSARIARTRAGVPADVDGGEPAALPDRARGKTGLTQGHAGTRMGAARRYRYTRDRQLHRTASPVYRDRSDEAAASVDRAGSGVPVRSGAEVEAGRRYFFFRM